MRRAWRYVAFLIAVLTSFASLTAQASPQLTLKVNEDQMQFHLLPAPVLEIPFVNPTGQTAEFNFLLEMLDDKGGVQSSMSAELRAAPGTVVQKIAWTSTLPSDSPSKLGWFRLRYAIAPKAVPGSAAAEGVVQLGRILTDAFEVRITGAYRVALGAKYPIRVRVDDPANGRPLRGMAVEVEFSIDDDDDHAVTRKLTTDGDGYAVTVFDLPSNASAQKGEVSVTATRGEYEESELLHFEFLKPATLTVTTDKPLYQPGQTVHMRLLGFGFDKRAWEGAKIELTIKNEESDEEFHTTVTSSRFGVGTADWDIPEKLRLGNYEVRAEIQSPDEEYPVRADAEFRIGRYDLPTFTVTANPDRSYYLPSQEARVEVRADYLFGKPLQRARVKVVREAERRWNFREQKYDVEESGAVEGELDASGKFTARFELAKDFENFTDSRYQRFEDLSLAAYVTDLSTGRTEQRRFKLRLSREPIHIYLTMSDPFGHSEPIVLYVTSSYADGTPVSITGTIEAARPNEWGELDENPDANHRTPIASFHTNRLGVARLELAALPENLLVGRHERNYYSYSSNYYYAANAYESDANARDPHDALFLARGSDVHGLKGTGRQDFTVDLNKDYLEVRTDHALYHPEEAIAVSILANTKARDVVVAVAVDSGVVWSQMVHLSHGKAALTVPYDPRLRGRVTITAYVMAVVGDETRALSSVAKVIFPSPQDLHVGVKLQKTTFRPGETATAGVHVLTPDGKSVQSDLGVLVFDRAVAERVRSDEEFGRQYGFSIYDYFSYYANEFGGVTYRDLLNLDATQPFPPGLDLLAELMVGRGYDYESGDVTLSGGSADYGHAAASHFAVGEDPRFKQVQAAFDRIYAATGKYPGNETDYREEMKTAGINPDDLRDPWSVPYRPVFSVVGKHDVLSLVSNGVDKRPGTADDFAAKRFGWQYFAKAGRAIDAASAQYFEKTGKYIRDYPTLRDELKKRNIDLDALRDPWGMPYSFSFSVFQAFFKIEIASAGPDKRFDDKAHHSWDDVAEWNSLTHYFQQETRDLGRVLAENFAKTGKFPQNEDELRPLLLAAKLTPDKLIDPWGNPYHFGFSVGSRYSDRINVSTYSEYMGQPRKVAEVTPVTQQIANVVVTSYGPDNKPEAAFHVAQFSRVIAEQSSKDIKARATPNEPPSPGGKGSIAGTVTDPQGAVITGVSVMATLQETGQQFTTTTGSNGEYAFTNLPTGLYRVDFSGRGFKTFVVLQVPVEQSETTRVDTSLSVGEMSMTVEVNAEAPLVETTSSQITNTFHALPPEEAAKPLFTPRLRKYFPETLLWRPEIITDTHGNASFNFPMADNITSWEMSIVASTLDGKIGVAKKELRTFQPFFLEHDPPKVLTEGDRISLPVVLRNYTDEPQTVATELGPQPWFSILSAPRQSVTIAPNGDASAVFNFVTTESIKSGTQRVTARNTETGDAVERQINVHPDGQEISFSVAKVLDPRNDALDWEVPSPAIHGSAEAELRIYPNLMAHLLDAIRGLAKRPAGCGEQITSTGYANLLVLQALKKAGQSDPDPKSPQFAVASSARKHLEEGYHLLSGMQMPDGGFRYWSDMESDVALTAYVFRFWHSASEFIEIDTGDLAKARTYLLSHQSSAGAWQRYDWRLKKNVDNPALTAYVARALALTKADIDEKERKPVDQSLALAMDYLETEMSSWNDAYVAGNYALAAVAMGRKERISKAQTALVSLAHNEGAATYWNLEANTSPFYGWGRAGRLETTALAVEALSQLQAEKPGSVDPQQINRGLQYLISHKDPYAMWYSTQATQNVLEAMILALPQGPGANGGTDATVTVNGKKVSSIKMPQDDEITGPITLELDRFLEPGRNQVRVVRSTNSSALNATVLASYYVPHSQSPATKVENLLAGDTRALRLKVHFDRTDFGLADAVRCEVETERIGFQGYGMMIAEIGLPPGADVDRASLDKAKGAGFINEYDVLPDRVVFYVWPKAGGLKFDFQFHSRFRMDAMSGPSLLYDYYNPDASATVAPVKFSVH